MRRFNKEIITNNGRSFAVNPWINRKQFNFQPMKKQILILALATAMIGALATGCGASKSASGSDTTSIKDTSKVVTPAATDTAKRDTAKKDTTHH